MDLILVRHGEIPSNIKRVYAGRSPEYLTDRGIRQAEEVSARLSNLNIDVIYTSPIRRAVQTAEIINAQLNVALEINNAFRELEMGPWEGMSETDVAREYPEEWDTWNKRPAELRLPGRETLDELLRRVISGIQGLYLEKERKHAVLVTHVAIIRVILLWKAGKDLNLYKTIHVPNVATFTVSLDTMPCL